jgi:signal peptidase I
MHSDLLKHAKNGLFLDLLRKSGRARLRVAGNSMLPTLRAGDMIVVEAINDTAVRPADIVVFLQSGTFCTHRVWKSGRSTVVTRGDMNRHLDSPISQAECLARVVAIERKDSQIRTLAPRPVLSLVLRYSNLGRKVFLWMIRDRGAVRMYEPAGDAKSW